MRADGLPTNTPAEISRSRPVRKPPQDQVPTSFAARAAASCGLRLPIQFSYAETLDKAIAGRR
jgi:CRISPR-associated endonuclease/helicase Cas3